MTRKSHHPIVTLNYPRSWLDHRNARSRVQPRFFFFFFFFQASYAVAEIATARIILHLISFCKFPLDLLRGTR